MRGLLLLFAICAAAGQDVQIPPDLFALTLAVTDEASQPIAGAEVSLEEKLLGYTDSDGKYFLPHPDLVLGPHDLHFLGRHVFGLRISASGFAEGTATVAVSDSGDALDTTILARITRSFRTRRNLSSSAGRRRSETQCPWSRRPSPTGSFPLQSEGGRGSVGNLTGFLDG